MTAYYRHHFHLDTQETFTQHEVFAALRTSSPRYYEYDYNAGYQPVALVPPELVVPSRGGRGAAKVNDVSVVFAISPGLFL